MASAPVERDDESGVGQQLEDQSVAVVHVTDREQEEQERGRVDERRVGVGERPEAACARPRIGTGAFGRGEATDPPADQAERVRRLACCRIRRAHRGNATRPAG